jgi:hypothetical protein
MNVRQMKNFLYLQHFMGMIRDVDGAVVECGVGKGRTFLILSFLIGEEDKGRTIWGFDSFKGFPEPHVKDASPRNPKTGEWSGTSPEDIRRILRYAGIKPDFVGQRTMLISGFFENTMNKYDGKPIALLHIDADLYESYVTVLRALVPFVADGGVVLFDEYGTEKWPGATKAVDEFLSGTAWKLERHDRSGKYFFIKSA